MNLEALKRLLLSIAPDMRDCLVFGGLALASYGVGLAIGTGWGFVLAGAGLFWLGEKRA